MLDSHFIDRVAAEAKDNFDKNPYDSTNFVLALNMPVTTILREAILGCTNETTFANGTLTSVPFKLRVVQSYIDKIQAATGLRPTLNSDLTLTVTLCNDEFNASDLAFLMSRFPDQFRVPKKKRRFAADVPIDSIYNKARVAAILTKLKAENTISYKMSSPTRECTFSVVFEREPIFIASRYCKFSRNLPQSPWTASVDIPKVRGNSVCEKIASPFIRVAKCDSTRFIASGREDIDVRMLGSGRPFALQLINPHLTAPFRGEQLGESLKKIAEEINSQCDIRLGAPLRRISMKETESLKVRQDEKRKSYTAYCYSTQSLDEKLLDELSSKAPIEISQKTPVRVLKRRPLLDRKRTIFALQALKLDEFHFLIRLETQAGTYVKEFVHGDFGRTRPSLADLLKVEHGEVDILDLDVDNVDMEWPPPDGSLG
uniref:tRNA pseudouridine(55) synthase n=1 Tax=Ascaris suum TaxID=6253 RepID=F1L2C4_ASCSU